MKLELSNLGNAIRSLEKALQITADKILQEDVSTDEIDLMKAGVIQNFEFSYELCWKSMKRWIEYNVGAETIDGVTRKELFRRGVENKLISDIDIWMEFHRARNISSHIYDDKTAEEVYEIASKFPDYAKNFSRVWRVEMINVTESQMQIILRILDRYVPDSQVWAFGSRVKGNFKSYSDLDLVVISEDKMSITEFGELIEAFQESDLPFRVDVLDWYAISPEFRQVIKRKYKVLKVDSTAKTLI